MSVQVSNDIPVVMTTVAADPPNISPHCGQAGTHSRRSALPPWRPPDFPRCPADTRQPEQRSDTAGQTEQLHASREHRLSHGGKVVQGRQRSAQAKQRKGCRCRSQGRQQCFQWMSKGKVTPAPYHPGQYGNEDRIARQIDDDLPPQKRGRPTVLRRAAFQDDRGQRQKGHQSGAQ